MRGPSRAGCRGWMGARSTGGRAVQSQRSPKHPGMTPPHLPLITCLCPSNHLQRSENAFPLPPSRPAAPSRAPRARAHPLRQHLCCGGARARPPPSLPHSAPPTPLPRRARVPQRPWMVVPQRPHAMPCVRGGRGTEAKKSTRRFPERTNDHPPSSSTGLSLLSLAMLWPIGGFSGPVCLSKHPLLFRPDKQLVAWPHDCAFMPGFLLFNVACALPACDTALSDARPLFALLALRPSTLSPLPPFPSARSLSPRSVCLCSCRTRSHPSLPSPPFLPNTTSPGTKNHHRAK